jgi:hypothetical protein
VRPKALASPREAVQLLLSHRLFIPNRTPVAIGNETDMFHPANTGYLIDLLVELQNRKVVNPIVLITKAPLRAMVLKSVKGLRGLQIIIFLSYSGLDRTSEPNFTDDALRDNFRLAKSYGFKIAHYWRPIIPENSTDTAVERMLSFVSESADASVLVGLKVHPELTPMITANNSLTVPDALRETAGEWLPAETVARIYAHARRLCPQYPLYRHSSCALALLLSRANHTATYHRNDICPPSHCPSAQRSVCSRAANRPTPEIIAAAMSRLDRNLSFTICSDFVAVNGEVSQEEFAYLLHNINFPIRPTNVRMHNIYHGSIYDGLPKC